VIEGVGTLNTGNSAPWPRLPVNSNGPYAYVKFGEFHFKTVDDNESLSFIDFVEDLPYNFDIATWIRTLSILSYN